jgi:hypothetical protein
VPRQGREPGGRICYLAFSKPRNSRCNQRPALPASGPPCSLRDTVARTHEPSSRTANSLRKWDCRRNCSAKCSRICACPLLLRGSSVGHNWKRPGARHDGHTDSAVSPRCRQESSGTDVPVRKSSRPPSQAQPQVGVLLQEGEFHVRNREARRVVPKRATTAPPPANSGQLPGSIQRDRSDSGRRPPLPQDAESSATYAFPS